MRREKPVSRHTAHMEIQEIGEKCWLPDLPDLPVLDANTTALGLIGEGTKPPCRP
jgi:hypothetical protein